MRKEFKNAKAKHGLNSKKKMGKKANWHKAKHGLITKAKVSFGLQNKKGRAQTDRRRGEEKKRIEGKRRRRMKKEEEFKEDLKVWNLTFSMDYLDFLVWIHVLGCGM